MNKKIIMVTCVFLLLGVVAVFAWQAIQVSPLDADSEELKTVQTSSVDSVSEETQVDLASPLYPIYITIDTQVANLKKLGMVWGFTKYTHLAFLTGERCWDEELLCLIPIVKYAAPEDVNDILYNWFIGLGDNGFDNGGSVFLLVPINFAQAELGVLYYPDFLKRIEGIYWLNRTSDRINEASWLSRGGNRDGTNYALASLRVDKSRFEALDEDDEQFGWLRSLQILDEKYMHPLVDMGWLRDESFLGSSLVAAFSRFTETPIIDRARAPVYFDALGASNFTNQRLHVAMDFEDVGYRLLGLFRLWNAMKYFFPYIDIIDGDWNEILLEHIPRMIAATDRLSYELTLVSLASRISDAHVFFISPLGNNRPDRFDHIFGGYIAPARFTEAEGHLVVIEHVFIPIPNQVHEPILMPGDVILMVNGIDIDEIVANMLQYISYPNEEKALFYLNGYMILRQHDSNYPMVLDILRNNIEITVEVQAVDRRQHARRFMLLIPAEAYERLENNIGLVNPSRVQGMGDEGGIPHIMQYFADTDGLIVDLRQRPTDISNFPFALSEYLVEESQLGFRVTVPSQSIPGMFIDLYRDYSGGISGIFPYSYFYENNVVVLIDERSFSFPESIVMMFRNGANVTVMGSNTMGANGNFRTLPLPGGVTMRFSSVGMFTPEGGQTQRIGLEPDIHVPRTIAGIRDGRDELLEAAIQYLILGNPSQR